MALQVRKRAVDDSVDLHHVDTDAVRLRFTQANGLPQVPPAAQNMQFRVRALNPNNPANPNAANRPFPLQAMSGAGTVNVPIANQVLLNQINTQTDAFEAELNRVLGAQHAGENLAGLKFRYEFSHKRVAYTTDANPEVRYLIIDDNSLAHGAIRQCITALETTVEQIRGKPIARLSYNEQSLTLIGGSRSYTKIESSALAKITNSPFDEAMNKALNHHLGHEPDPVRDHDAVNKINVAKTRHAHQKTQTNTEIARLERQAAPLSQADQELLQELKDRRDKLEQMNGYVIGLAILASVTTFNPRTALQQPKKCSELIAEGNSIKDKMKNGLKREENTAWKTKVIDKIYRSARSEREQTIDNNVAPYYNGELTQLLLDRAYHSADNLEMGRSQSELLYRLQGVEQPAAKLEDYLVAYYAGDLDADLPRAQTILASWFKSAGGAALAPRLIQP